VKTPAVVMLLASVLSLQGCTYVSEVEPTNLSVVREGTATRTDVEAVLGKPLESRDTNESSINVYAYDRGAEGGNVNVLDNDQAANDALRCIVESAGLCILAYPVLQVGVWVSTPFLYASKVDEQEGHLIVVYSANDRAVCYRGGPSVADIDAMIDGEVEYSPLRIRAKDGDPDAQFKFALYVDDFQHQYRWFCLAAHQNHPSAQYKVGEFYRLGRTPVSQSYLQAYMWYTLGAEQGNTAAQGALRPISRILSPAQIAEAERLVAEWEPNPAQCEIIAAQAEN
jgi:TPR repeat protein